MTNTHVKRYREHYHDAAGGHLYQGRFKSFPVQDDPHLLTVLRYVEANPLRAGLAERAGEWPWCGFAVRQRGGEMARALLSDWPVDRPADWAALVEARWADTDLAALRRSARRGSPYGAADWVERVAGQLGLAATLRPPERPKKAPVIR